MDQNALVTDELDDGRKLIDVVTAEGFDVRLALWVKETDAGRWYLYLVSPYVDANGGMAAYMKVLPLVDRVPELGPDPYFVKLVGVNAPMARAAEGVLSDRGVLSTSATGGSRRIQPRVTRFGGPSLGGVEIEGAYIYPPFEPAGVP